ncbi:MAG TPA: PEP/pyruvate-binding domain-containing protein, partial [Gammaproteobacteria bacterium]|nr:PEP/pyruvate-binding domain-containing protein [Gammaproteobacteria bacterium]
MSELVVPLSAAEAADAERFGPKAANQAALGLAGIPIPGGYAVDAEAYRTQLRSLGLEAAARSVFSTGQFAARRHALDVKLGLLDQPIDDTLAPALLDAWNALMSVPGALGVVRSSALVEDRFGSSFAGQFESFLGLKDETEFLTAVRSCWCALWSTRALRYMATHDLDPADTAMALAIQPLVNAKISGGGLSRTAEGDMLLSATWGLGSAIAQGEVVPDRYVVDRTGRLLDMTTGRKFHSVGCVHGTSQVDRRMAEAPCLNEDHLRELADYLVRAEEVVGGAT